ncbi:HAD family hydrolase [Catelliglobosispora koreensis]|uniref:HAD family hydrolase n=1 Tax=Catelliglobosispora koreensis TaxID=129052 RepID=UPI0003679A42|nr:HAD family hydrolase [Catelliglobosispora koreensis]
MILRAVLFDLYDTLIKSSGPKRFAQVSRDMGAALGVDPEDFRQLFAQTGRERMRGELGTVEETLRTLALRLGSTPTESAIRFAAVMWQRMHHDVLWPTPATLSLLDTLRAKRLKLGLVSNASEESALLWPKQPMAARFRVTVFSCDVGLLKPDPAIYKVACTDLRVKPENCIYVGDNADEELAGAQSLGMRALRTTEHRDGPAWAGESIRRLTDLIDLLE